MTNQILTKLVAITFLFVGSYVSASTLQAINFSELPGERAEIRLQFDQINNEPAGYTIESPARIVLDFAETDNSISAKKHQMSVGEVDSAVIVSGGGRTRIIVNLDNFVPYTASIQGSEYVIEVGAEAGSARSPVASNPSASNNASVQASADSSQISAQRLQVENIDFRRGETGEGLVIVTLNDPKINVDIEEVSGGVQVHFFETEIPDQLVRKLDVIDFATPVQFLTSKQVSSETSLKIEASGDYDYLAYQVDNEYVISVKPLTEDQIEERKSKFSYVGERLSLNFQDIQIRNVLQLIADFTNLNLVASDTVSGSITLRLENVPWDQALDIVLRTKGLDKRQIGNVLMVAPAAEIAERERQEIETTKQLEELAPLRTEYIRVKYANAAELFQLFVSSEGGEQEAEEGAQTATGSILSSRGHAIVDDRTNSIILTDTQEKINEFKELIDKVDIPIRQVMIEARIVVATTDFLKELGVRVAGDAVETSDGQNNKFEFTGRLEGLVNGNGAGPEANFVDGDGDGVTDDERNLIDSNIVDLGVFNPAGAFTFNFISSNVLLGLELSALQDSGFAEIVSQPKVITGDKQQASIRQGQEIPFLEESLSGGSTVSFKEAVLSLDVTPQITPDDRIIMDLEINQDSLSGITNGVPTLDVTRLETQVLVNDGETVVLGGIYQTETVIGQTKVPLLGDIPLLGRLFRNDSKSEEKLELLIFITPRILAQNFIE